MTDIFDNILHLLRYVEGEPMLFSSGLFWALFLIFIPVYAAVKKRRTQMMVFVLLFSLYFYYKSSGLFVGLLLGTSVIDWVLSHRIAASQSRRARRLYMLLSLTCSLGILAYFKYANFFLWNWSALTGSNFAPLQLILPIGISFYTFQSVSYIVEVYKGRVAPAGTWLEYVFFLSFFPALLAGPITRPSYFLPQIAINHRPRKCEVYMGFWLILLGVIKKAIIADYICQYNDLIFSIDPATGVPGYSGFECMMGIIGYTMQIYCDFSGYSDMAIGIAMIMGFKLAVNFNFPYKSRNLTDFWRRWHISLSTWLRDYVYIPLGGNRKGTARTYLNNFVTMLVGGLWHGAAWKFIFWGGMHGAGLAVHKASKPVFERIGNTAVMQRLAARYPALQNPGETWPARALAWLLTMAVVAMLWVFFRADTFGDAVAVIGHAFSDFSWDYLAPFASVRWLWLVLMGVIIVAHALPTSFWPRAAAAFVRSNWLVKLIIFIVVIQLVLQLRGQDVPPFIYFQF